MQTNQSFEKIIQNCRYRMECLTGEAVLSTRPLWEAVFSEDSPAFTAYYFEEKATHNTTFIYRQTGASSEEIVSMVHLTPYEITINGKSFPTYYIVGVATRADLRHHGLMAALLEQAFSYARQKGAPFVFLMPANPKIYEPFGFSYLYSRSEYHVPDIITQHKVYINYFPVHGISIQCFKKSASETQLQQLSDFATQTLPRQYDYYLTRTPAYYELLLKELASENGCIYTFTVNGSIEGYFLYANEGNAPFIQELLFSDALQKQIAAHGITDLFPKEKPQKKPIIMAKNLVSACHLDEPFPNASMYRGFINELV